MKELLALCLNHWKLFVVSVALSLAVGAYYLLSTQSTFTRTVSVLVKDGKNGGDANQQLEELGIDMTSSNITDEIVAIHSPAVVYEMVQRLHLNMSYSRPGFFKDLPLYAESLPIEVVMHDVADNDVASFRLKLEADGSVKMSNMTKGKEKLQGEVALKLDKKQSTPYGKVTVSPSLYYKKGQTAEINVTRISINSASKKYNSAISAKLQEKNSNIIDVQCVDVSTARAENILNTIVNIYNENWIKNRNQISVATSEFIKERLEVIEQELGSVDDDISSYKSAHSMPDVNAVASQAMSQANETSRQGMELGNQLYMAKYIRNYVTGGQHVNQLLPANSGINNPYIEQQISEYNNMQLERNNLVANSSEQNPLVMDIDRNLNIMRHAIINSLDNEITTLNTQQRSTQSSHSQAMARMTANPIQAKYLLSVERQQKVKESLYLFLLQKREENELSQAFTAYNTRIIASPHGSDAPTAPIKSNIMLIALVVGLLVPGAIIFIIESTNTSIRGRKDLENINVPFVGEIPLWRKKEPWWRRRKSMDKKEVRVVVKKHSRNVVNEAFRVVRTNLELITNVIDTQREGNGKIVMFTSYNPGSGKTFICGNLAASFTISGKKAIAVDLDLRRASLSSYVNSPKEGVTDYLIGEASDYKSYVIHGEASGLDVIPVGTIPPNPTELLLSKKMKQLLEQLRRDYDYIFVDCPPVDIVADATILSGESDVTIFIVRSGLMQKSMLPELEKNYEEKRFPNLSVLLNGTDVNSHYGYNRYGYGYGRSGYGYSYGYGYGSKKD